MKLDQDIPFMNLAQLKAEVLKLRRGIRADRDSRDQQLCWYRPELWNLLPESSPFEPVPPEPRNFLENCVKFRTSLSNIPNFLILEQATAAEAGVLYLVKSQKVWNLASEIREEAYKLPELK